MKQSYKYMQINQLGNLLIFVVFMQSILTTEERSLSTNK